MKYFILLMLFYNSATKAADPQYPNTRGISTCAEMVKEFEHSLNSDQPYSIRPLGVTCLNNLCPSTSNCLFNDPWSQFTARYQTSLNCNFLYFHAQTDNLNGTFKQSFSMRNLGTSCTDPISNSVFEMPTQDNTDIRHYLRYHPIQPYELIYDFSDRLTAINKTHPWGQPTMGSGRVELAVFPVMPDITPCQSNIILAREYHNRKWNGYTQRQLHNIHFEFMTGTKLKEDDYALTNIMFYGYSYTEEKQAIIDYVYDSLEPYFDMLSNYVRNYPGHHGNPSKPRPNWIVRSFKGFEFHQLWSGQNFLFGFSLIQNHVNRMDDPICDITLQDDKDLQSALETLNKTKQTGFSMTADLLNQININSKKKDLPSFADFSVLDSLVDLDFSSIDYGSNINNPPPPPKPKQTIEEQFFSESLKTVSYDESDLQLPKNTNELTQIDRFKNLPILKSLDFNLTGQGSDSNCYPYIFNNPFTNEPYIFDLHCKITQQNQFIIHKVFMIFWSLIALRIFIQKKDKRF